MLRPKQALNQHQGSGKHSIEREVSGVVAVYRKGNVVKKSGGAAITSPPIWYDSPLHG